MKKLMTMVAVAFAVAAGTTGAKAEEARTWEWSPLGIGIAAPIQLPYVESDVYGLRLGGFFGRNADVVGLDVSLAGMESGTMIGLALAGFNWAGADAYGVQVGVVANVVRDNAHGLQIGLVNADFGEANTGFEVGAFNYALAYRGLQFGVLTWNATVSAGFQAGVANYNFEDFAGAACGAVNFAGQLSGCQVGVINFAKDATGCQIGLVNATERMHGVQLGVLNLITESSFPIMVIANASF